MSGIAMAITGGTTGTVAAMIGAIADGMDILTATGVTHDQTGGTGSGEEIEPA
jgi:hypothetical protein